MVEVNSWLVGRRPSDSTPSPLLPHPSSSVATQRKSLRLTGSHGITGTRDIYASAPTDRSITRNKEIANLLQEPSTTPAPSDSSTLSAHSHPPPISFLFFDIVRHRVEGGSGPRVISAFMGRDCHGSSGNVPDDGEKKLRQGWVVGCSERG